MEGIAGDGEKALRRGLFDHDYQHGSNPKSTFKFLQLTDRSWLMADKCVYLGSPSMADFHKQILNFSYFLQA